MSDPNLIITILGVATPFLLLMISMDMKLEKLVTTIELCPNCPKRKT